MPPDSTNRQPTRLTPQELLLSKLPGLLDLWERDRGNESLEKRSALDLVTVWCALQRLVIDPKNPNTERIAQIMHEDAARFLDAVHSHVFDFRPWQAKMEALDADWDSGWHASEELEWRTHELFSALDQTELIGWFATVRAPADIRFHDWLARARQACMNAERFLAERPDLFLCLATDLATVVAASRPELAETDPLLWETLGKHRRIEEARDEVELTQPRTSILAAIPRSTRGFGKSASPSGVSNTPAAPTSVPSDLSDAKFKVGDLVCTRANPTILLPVIEVVPGGAERRYRVFENNAKATYYESQLQTAHVPTEKRRVIAVRELHARLTSLQILSPSTANLFSLRSGRVQFVPYQYRPVLKLIRADRPRLLIADEVGVGKTIETGLILKELRARMEISSVLVICPKALVAERKWFNEMKRFDEQFTALDGPLLRHCLQETHVDGEWPEQYSKAILPFSLFDAELVFGVNGRRKKKGHGLQALDPPPKFDLVIVDEAHHIRNTANILHHGVRYFCDNAQALVLLTATPVQMKTDDLFTLLNVLRPDLVIDRASFEQMAEPNPHISEAVKHCRRADSQWQKETLACLNKAATTTWGRLFVRESPAFREIHGRLQHDALGDRDRVALTRSVEELYTFSSLINRTRRRDIGTFTTRKPETLTVPFTPEQESLHNGILDVVARILSRSHGQQNVKFMMTTIRRQAASCLYGLGPMLSDILMGKLDNLDILEANDDAADTDQSWLEKVRSDIERLLTQANQLAPLDPKVDAFIKVLHEKSTRPNNKALVFSTFRHTLKYLEAHTQRAGLRAGLILGDVPDDERSNLRRRFSLPQQDADAIDVLLSSEVGCEGLDFQFCDLLINYDLPWNPMKIEQRIGRIDRYGQPSETVVVVNIITPGTVDADIYERCLSRIGVFQHAIGGSEEILGEITRELHAIAESFALGPKERAERLQQLADNGIRQIREEEELETKQAEFFGLNVPNQSWREEIQAAESFWLSPSAIQGSVKTYLAGRLGTETEYFLGDKPLKTLRLSQEARGRLLDDYKLLPRCNELAYREWEKWLKGSLPTLSVTFEQETAVEHPKAAHLSVLHPLVRQAARHLEVTEPTYVTLTAQSNAIPPKSHFFALYRWAKHGAKPDESLVMVANDPEVESSLFSLLQSANDNGPVALPSIEECDALDTLHHRKWTESRSKFVEDNRKLVEHRIQSLTASHHARRKAIEDQIDRATNDRIRLMKESELARADADFSQRLAELQQAANSGEIRATPVVFGTFTVVAEAKQ